MRECFYGARIRTESFIILSNIFFLVLDVGFLKKLAYFSEDKYFMGSFFLFGGVRSTGMV